jgi:hypothetical protein
MQNSIILFLALCAAPVEGRGGTQSAPFVLRFKSANPTFNNSLAATCHVGASIESICVDPGPEVAIANIFYHSYMEGDDFEGNLYGSLVWIYPTTADGIPINITKGAEFHFDMDTNIAVALFSPSNPGTYGIGFDSDHKMFYYSYFDDSSIIQGEDVAPRPNLIYNWYICWNRVGYGYIRNALVWGTGGQPRNPTCSPVTVVREFI